MKGKVMGNKCGEEKNVVVHDKKKNMYVKPSCQKLESLKNLAIRGNACGGVSGGSHDEDDH